MRFSLFRRWSAAVLLAFVFTAHAELHSQNATAASSPDSAFSIPKMQLILPDEMNRLLQSPAASRPVVMQVGSHVLYAESHIAGAEYAGPGSQASGLADLKGKVTALPRNTFIVLYCGCCPWNRCPNIGPAFKLLHDLGFTNVKALYLADNFGSNWVDKGYPVEHGR